METATLPFCPLGPASELDLMKELVQLRMGLLHQLPLLCCPPVQAAAPN